MFLLNQAPEEKTTSKVDDCLQVMDQMQRRIEAFEKRDRQSQQEQNKYNDLLIKYNTLVYKLNTNDHNTI